MIATANFYATLFLENGFIDIPYRVGISKVFRQHSV